MRKNIIDLCILFFDMKITKKRLRKKMHRKHIWIVCLEASLSPKWRDKLFRSKEGDVFDFTRSDLAEFLEHDPHLRKYRFHFSVKVAPKSSSPLWMQIDPGVIFEFRANEFPEVCTYSNNNPDTIQISTNNIPD